jgi:Zn ribbon nucleic-acid-binding protein
MQTKTVKCPSCEVVLEVKNSKNEEVKIINCPQCGTALRVRFPKQTNEAMDAETHIAGVNRGSETIIANVKNASGKAVIVCEGKRYELREGSQIVGRKANTLMADVQLDVADRYMSRLNGIINVRKAGGQLLVSIANHKNQNPIKVGMVQLQPGDEIILNDGDVFTMGKTTMTLKIEQS